MATHDRPNLRAVNIVAHADSLLPDHKLDDRAARDFRDTQPLALAPEGSHEVADLQERQKLARDAAIRGGPQERVSFLLNEILIHTPDVCHVISTIEELISHARLFPNPGGVRVIASGGMGKNAVIRYFLRKYAPALRGNVYVCPILSVDFRGRLAWSDTLKILLQQLRCAYRNHQSIPDLEDNVLAAINACGTNGIFFNEAQHLVYLTQSGRRTGARIAGQAGDLLKRFIDEINIPCFFFGVPGWDEAFIADTQLDTRIPHRCQIREFKFDSVFVGLLRALDTAIPMPEPAGLDRPDIAPLLYAVCKGNWRRLIYLLRDAMVSATRAGQPRIDLADLEGAYRLQFGADGNPFIKPKTV